VGYCFAFMALRLCEKSDFIYRFEVVEWKRVENYDHGIKTP
jgi:hypothetical protein